MVRQRAGGGGQGCCTRTQRGCTKRAETQKVDTKWGGWPSAPIALKALGTVILLVRETDVS